MWMADTTQTGNVSRMSRSFSRTACQKEPAAAGSIGRNDAAAQDRKAGETGDARQGVDLEISDTMLEMYQRQAEQMREAGEKAEDKAIDIGKAMEVARRIARGDKVPPRDEKKLMEYSADLYQMAKSAALLSAGKKHKKHKSLYKDEEDHEMEEKLRALDREEGSLPEVSVQSPAAAEESTDAEPV